MKFKKPAVYMRVGTEKQLETIKHTKPTKPTKPTIPYYETKNLFIPASINIKAGVM